MKRSLLIGLGVAAMAGCAGKSSSNADSAAHVDADTIAEAPMPTIQANTYAAAGDLAASRGQFARAAGQYDLALKANPNDAAIIKKQALAYVKADQLPAAIDAWKRYLAASKGTDDAYGSLGYAYELARQPAAAESTYKQGVAAHPDGRLTRVNYGLMLVRRGDVDGAVKQLGAVLTPPEVNYDVASVYAELGRRDLAKFYYKRALECDPGFEPAREKLAAID